MTDQKDIRTTGLMKRLKVLKDKVVRRREQFDELMEFVEKETVYLTIPASTKYHLI